MSMEATRDGLWDWNIQTNDIYFSPGYFEMIGYPPDEQENSFDFWKNLLHPDDRAQAIKANTD